MGLLNKIAKGTVNVGSTIASGTKEAFVGSETDADLLLITFFLFTYLANISNVPAFGSTRLGKVGANLNYEAHVPSYLKNVHDTFMQTNKFMELQTYCACLDLFMTKYNRDVGFINFYADKRYNDPAKVKEAKDSFKQAVAVVNADKFTLPFKYDPSLETVAATIKVNVGKSCSYTQQPSEISMFLL
jgi:hypothetical protein